MCEMVQRWRRQGLCDTCDRRSRQEAVREESDVEVEVAGDGGGRQCGQ